MRGLCVMLLCSDIVQMVSYAPLFVNNNQPGSVLLNAELHTFVLPRLLDFGGKCSDYI